MGRKVRKGTEGKKMNEESDRKGLTNNGRKMGDRKEQDPKEAGNENNLGKDRGEVARDSYSW